MCQAIKAVKAGDRADLVKSDRARVLQRGGAKGRGAEEHRAEDSTEEHGFCEADHHASRSTAAPLTSSSSTNLHRCSLNFDPQGGFLIDTDPELTSAPLLSSVESSFFFRDLGSGYRLLAFHRWRLSFSTPEILRSKLITSWKCSSGFPRRVGSSIFAFAPVAPTAWNIRRASRTTWRWTETRTRRR